MAGVAIAMPRLGMTMEEGTVVEWPIPVGGRVEKGQTVLVIETEKAEAEIEAITSGTFRYAFVEPGETVPCGTLLGALTETPEEAFEAAAFAAAYVPPAGLLAVEEPTASESATPPRDAGSPAFRGESAESAERAERDERSERGRRQPVAPAARALAKKLGIELDGLTGSGPNGRITKQDVEAVAAARERLVNVAEGVGLEVLRAGAGEGVVLLPGFGTDVSSFALQTPSLVDDFEVIAVNPRGVGASDSPAQAAYEVGRAADDVAGVLSGPTHVVGASLGAATAIELALRHPDRVRSLTLITPFVEVTPRLLGVADAWCRVATEASAETVAAFLAPWLFGDALLADDATRGRTLHGLAQSVRRISPETLERSAAGMAAWSGSRSNDLANINAPTLVLVAGCDLLTPDGEGVAAAIPKATCEVIPGCGHALTIEAAEIVNRLLREHLVAS